VGKVWCKAKYRNTKMGGLDISIAICKQCKKIIEPIHKERSKGGTHGYDYYSHEHYLDFIVLKQTNSGKRSIVCSRGLRPFSYRLYVKWIVEGVEPEEMINYIQNYLIPKLV
jgi:hypothetical protein